jgi:hypothetical protein
LEIEWIHGEEIMSDELMNLRTVVNTMKLMTITAQRLADHASIVGNGELILELDTLRLQVQNTGLVAEQLLSLLVGDTPTEEFPAIKAAS